MNKREAFVKNAKQYIGMNWNSIDYNYMLNQYNSINPLPRDYAINNKDPWCAIFVSFVGHISGLDEIILPECSCTKMRNLYKEKGFFYRLVNYDTLQEGDLVFYDWDGDNSPDHVGIIRTLMPNGKLIEVIEGNMNCNTSYDGIVGRRVISYESPLIEGFAFPNFEKFDNDYNQELGIAQNFCVQNEIIKGDENGYRWKDTLTREEAALMLYRLFNTFEDMI